MEILQIWKCMVSRNVYILILGGMRECNLGSYHSCVCKNCRFSHVQLLLLMRRQPVNWPLFICCPIFQENIYWYCPIFIRPNLYSHIYLCKLQIGFTLSVFPMHWTLFDCQRIEFQKSFIENYTPFVNYRIIVLFFHQVVCRSLLLPVVWPRT